MNLDRSKICTCIPGVRTGFWTCGTETFCATCGCFVLNIDPENKVCAHNKIKKGWEQVEKECPDNDQWCRITLCDGCERFQHFPKPLSKEEKNFLRLQLQSKI